MKNLKVIAEAEGSLAKKRDSIKNIEMRLSAEKGTLVGKVFVLVLMC